MEWIAVVLVIVAATWFAVYVQRARPLWGCLGFLVAGYVFGHAFWSWDAGPLTLTLDRVVLLGVVTAAIVQWRLGHLDPLPPIRTDALLAAFVALLILSAFLLRSATTPSEGPSAAWRLLAAYLVPCLLYGLTRQSPHRNRGTRDLLLVLTGLGTYLALTAMAEATQSWSFVFPRYIADPDIGIHFGRARGPALASQSLGLYLSICFFAAWLVLPLVPLAVRLLILASLPCYAAALLATCTRAAWLAGGAGIIVILMFKLHGRGRMTVLTATAACALLAATVARDKIVAFQRETSAADTRHSVYQRAGFAYVSWKMFLDHPFLGIGLGNFSQGKKPYLSDRSVDLRLESLRDLEHHNTFLSLLTETGIIGLTLFAAVLICWAQTGWSLAHCAGQPNVCCAGLLLLGTLAAYACVALFHDVALTPSSHWILFLIAGHAVGTHVDNGRTK